MSVHDQWSRTGGFVRWIGASFLYGRGRVIVASGGRAGSARRRADDAAARAGQVADRLRRLRSGEPSGVTDVERSRLAVAEAIAAANRQYEYSRDAHLRAARSHVAAARALDRAGNPAAGQRHRDAARADEIRAGLATKPLLTRPHGAGRDPGSVPGE
jgi:hypothetical protein